MSSTNTQSVPLLVASMRSASISAVVLVTMSLQKNHIAVLIVAPEALERSNTGEMSVEVPPSMSCEAAVAPATPSPVVQHLLPAPAVASVAGDEACVPDSVPMGTPRSQAPAVSATSLATVQPPTPASKLSATTSVLPVWIVEVNVVPGAVDGSTLNPPLVSDAPM